MSRPLPPGDPAQLGPYRLSARLSESPAGIVFLGVDGEGRQATVAVLTRGAAGDAAARDRFRAAIAAAVPGPGRPPELGPGDPAPVVAAQPDGPAPWVAAAYESERAGAERFLEPVLLEGAFRSRRLHGPQFQPHWLGGGEPALERPPAPAAAWPGAQRRPERGLAAAIMMLAGVLVVLALLILVLFACEPKVDDPPPLPPEPTPSMRVPSPPPQTPATPSPPPTTSPGSPTPGPTGTGGDGGPL